VYQRLYAQFGPQHWWPGDTPLEIMIGAVLTQNTAWINVVKAISNLKDARVLSLNAIADTPMRRLARWIRPSGYFNVKAKRLKALVRWIRENGGIHQLARRSTASLRHALLNVHGVGPETADSILLYAFQRPVFVIDAYTRRVFMRLSLITGHESYEQLRLYFEQDLGISVRLFNEYHALIVAHGKTFCRPKPRCITCPLQSICPRKKCE